MRKTLFLPSVAAMGLVACSGDVVVIGPGEGGSGSGGAPGTPLVPDPRVDLLVVVDNTISMGPAQERLAIELEQLVGWLAAPPCVDTAGAIVPQSAPDGSCPAGAARAFAPVRDLHLGVISSSLGSLGGQQCAGAFGGVGSNDRGRLLTRGPAGEVATYGGLGFLAYDPAGAMSPPGEADFASFVARAKELVLGAGTTGCGYEMPLEAMTRFLVDPAPYEKVKVKNNWAMGTGLDDVVLEQRARFLRDRSNVIVLVASDENDCSIDLTPRTQAFLLWDAPFFRPTAACSTDKDHPCCTSCGLGPNPDCPNPDPGCAGDSKYAPAQDPQNLKCWDQKRRYGVEFRAPIRRYVRALSEPLIDPTVVDLAGPSPVTNPLFAAGRHTLQITFATIGGLPWQDVVVDASDPESRTRSASELESSGAWAWITGEAPLDPFMIESIAARVGSSPATGQSPSAANATNGGDRAIAELNDLQYACVFPLPAPVTDAVACGHCGEACDDPQCDGTTQVAAGVYPNRRQLEVARGLGERGVVGSMCQPPEAGGAAEAIVARLRTILP